MPEQPVEKTELIASHSSVTKKPNQVKETISLKPSETQTWERRGTRLQVVRKEGNWLKLQLRNGSTGWIHHSLAQPEREPEIEPLTVLKGSNGTSELLTAQPNMTKKARLAGEILSSVQNGSEVELFYLE
jgi:SH3-like domain-containing protein